MIEEDLNEDAETIHHTTAIAGTILADNDHRLLGEHPYVIGASDGRLVAREDSQIDHVVAFANIKKRVDAFLTFINDTMPAMGPIVTKIHGDFFIPVDGDTESLTGTKYLFVSIYNCLDNLWLMEHRANLEKSDLATEDWVLGQSFFRSFSQFVQIKGTAREALPLSALIDDSSFLDTFKIHDVIKPEFRGQLLGVVMRAYVIQHPDILDRLCQVHEKSDQSLDLLYGIRDLLMNIHGDSHQSSLQNIFDATAEQLRQKNKQAVKHAVKQLKEALGSPEIKAYVEKKLIATPLWKLLILPLSDSESEKSSSGKVSPANEVNRVLEGQFAALSVELKDTKENLATEAAKRIEAEQQIAIKDFKLIEAEKERATEAAKRIEAEQRAKDAEQELAQMKALLAALQEKK